ncbi:hypothetical protein TNCV_708061 [Trichonephila clavipes]|nr:hypothetical protein TNCV_708061 [Trichonephila clavipes]
MSVPEIDMSLRRIVHHSSSIQRTILFTHVNRRCLLGIRTVTQSSIPCLDRTWMWGLTKVGFFHSAEWHDGDWLEDGIREAWLFTHVKHLHSDLKTPSDICFPNLGACSKNQYQPH